MINTHPVPHFSIIVAMAENRAIGKDNDLLWHLGGDLRRFKQLTMGHPIVMGRRTWESLPKRPLPGRRNIVFSQRDDFAPEGAEVARSVNSLMTLLRDCDDEAFIIGGAAIYEMLLPFAERLYVTMVYRSFEADAFFPVIDLSDFTLVQQSERTLDEASGLEYAYIEYQRKYGHNYH